MKKKWKQRAAVAALTLALSVGNVMSAGAWRNTKDLGVTLRFTGQTANCSYRVNGLRGTKKIKATMTLKDLTEGRTVKTWKNLEEKGMRLSGSQRIRVAKNRNYRLTISAKVYNARNEAERVSDSMKQKCL